MAWLQRRPGHLERMCLKDFHTNIHTGTTYEVCPTYDMGELHKAGALEFSRGPYAYCGSDTSEEAAEEEEEQAEEAEAVKEWEVQAPHPAATPEPPLPVNKRQRDYFDYLRSENPADPLPGLQLLRTGGLRRILQLNKDSLRELQLIRVNDLLRDTAVCGCKANGLYQVEACLIPRALNRLSSLTTLRLLSLGTDPECPEWWTGERDTAFHDPWHDEADLTGIWELTQLTSLHLQSHGLGDFPPEISKLTQLQNLELEACGGWGEVHLEPAIGSLVSLRRLSLRATLLAAAGAADYCLGNLSNLAALDLSLCGIKCVPEFVSRLTALRELSLEIDARDDYAHDMLPAITALRELSLEIDTCNDYAHDMLPASQPEEDQIRVFLAGWNHLMPLTQLQKLCLSGNRTVLPHEVHEALPQLRVVHS
ncbi:hypothetical protein WJX72_011110 [[Myrmecia] bisecta]|uniref:Disease resistance R13L4/SHOC-2-like LRR domain-containing protein n=1 Tax=[Myrmecia] bisecta TaxID=41462 RepID=A0AAW1PKY5_9CHLO